MNTSLVYNEEGNIVLSDVDKANLNSILALLNGKKDSRCKLFKKPIKVDMNKLLLLEKMINDKLWLNGVENIATTIDIVFNNKEILNFKSLEQLESYNFNILNCSTKSISLEWDFLLK